jgi:spore coat polysaccharide biosynthesis protein SpsF
LNDVNRKENVVAIIQARMAAQRLPGKVLMEIAGKPMLEHVLARVKRARTVRKVVVATTTDGSDDVVEAFCLANGWDCYRGSMTDVLDRYYQAALQCKADVVVRITADCPLTDPTLIDEVVKELLSRKVDFAANRLPPPFQRTYPVGLDVEAARFKALERAWQKAKEKFEREHVMPYLYEKEGRFRIFVLNCQQNLGSMRWTVDTPEDLELVRRIFAHFQPRKDFSWLEVLDLFRQEPQLASINSSINPKTFLDVDGRFQPGEK